MFGELYTLIDTSRNLRGHALAAVTHMKVSSGDREGNAVESEKHHYETKKGSKRG